MPVFYYDPPDRFIAGSVGQPGDRTFYLQATSVGRVTSVVLEKFQVSLLAERIDELLDEVLRRTGDAAEIPETAPVALRERAGRARADPDPQHPGTVDRDVIRQRLDGGVALLLRFDDHPVTVAVPGERDRANPEVLGKRQVERPVVPQPRRGGLGDLDGVAGTAQHFVKELVDPFGKEAHLELLQDNARHPADRGRLQVERAIPRLPDGAGDEPVRRIIVKDRH